MSTEELTSQLMAWGMDEAKAKEGAKGKKTAKALLTMMADCKEVGHETVTPQQALLLYTLGPAFPKEDFMKDARLWCVRNICSGGIATSTQVSEATKYFTEQRKGHGTNAMLVVKEEEAATAAGIGISVSDDEIKKCIAEVIAAHSAELDENRYQTKPALLKALGVPLKWADGKVMAEELMKQLEARLGPMTEEDQAPPKKKKDKAASKEAKAKNKEKKEQADSKDASESKEEAGALDLQEGRSIPAAINTQEQRQGHLDRTKGVIRTRFPPEPNGFLHLGHAKAMNFNFGVARQRGGITYLRFDDTNPAAEKQEYIDNIITCADWLGHKPAQITYSSDYFPKLYECALKLIQDGNAYVCHQTKKEIEKSRETKPPTPSPFRDRSVEENLRLFDDMRKGKFPEGGATLRVKGDLSSPNPNMWDFVAYRVIFQAHPHVGDKWCVYPTYDFTHCIVDSLEDIDYSLCTLEFEVRRESYFWLLDVLDMYKPNVWEYSRLNVEYNVMSKRKLKALVDEGIVNGWDDPRLLTLMGLKRRGYTPEAINMLCEKVGVTRTANTARQALVDFCVRSSLDNIAERVMVVAEPLKVVLTNWEEKRVETITAKVFPNKPEDETLREFPLSRVVYIEQKDFRLVDDKDFFGLAPGKEAYLKYAYSMTCTDVVKDASGKPIELHCTVDFNSKEKRKKKVKGLLHWVSAQPGQKPLEVRLRLYERLFLHPDPAAIDEWRETINPNSLQEVTALAEAALSPDKVLADPTVMKKYQFERVGYFSVDPDSTKDRLVFNSTASLKDSR